MPCYRPIEGWRSAKLNDNGKRGIVFKRDEALVDMPVTLPCGRCVGCRLERSRQWAIRCLHESSLYEENCFITLTYSNEHLPTDMSLDVRVFQLFMKRLRKRFGRGIRFYHCGEYGAKYGRPHYHALLFNFDFEDKWLFGRTKRGDPLYRSETLEELWPYGYSSIGGVTFESAAYVARYIMKKITGDDAEQHYEYIDPETGEVFQRKPEYTTMSRRPGIGQPWFEKFSGDVYPHDFVVMRGRKFKPPKYYDGLYEVIAPEGLSGVKNKRRVFGKSHEGDSTTKRLLVRHKVAEERLSRLKRGLD